MHTGLNVYEENSGDSLFITNSLLVSYKWSQKRFTSCANLIFFVTFIKLYPIHIQKNIYCGWIEIKESPKYPNTNFNTGDLPKTTFSFHSNDTKRNPWVTLCLHCPINDSAVIYLWPFTLQLCYKPLGILLRAKLRVKRFKYQVMMHCKNFITLTLLDIGLKIFSGRGWKNRNFLHLPLIFLRTIQSSFPGIWEYIYHVKWGAERKLGTHPKTHCEYSCCNRNFQIFLTSDLHQLADDANEKDNLHVYFLFRLLIQTNFPLSQLFSQIKAKALQKKLLQSNFQENWNLKLGRIKRANSVDS